MKKGFETKIPVTFKEAEEIVNAMIKTKKTLKH